MKTVMSNSIRILFLLSIIFTLAACSGGSGQDVETGINDAVNNDDTGLVYSGPSATTDDVQNFKINIWDNLASADRCGGCHNDEVGQAPLFVRKDDINLAYEAANSIVDLTAPALSRMVTKVGGGHNCWRPDASVCADTVTNFIEAWANDSGAEANVIVLTAPVDREVGTSRSLPSDATGFGETVHPVLTQYCSSCHSEDSAIRQQPYFASNDLSIAYEAAKSRINLDDPGNSRFVLRLREEFHNCWGNCGANATEMQNAIQAFADTIPLTEVDPALVVSRALGLPDGIVASSGGRVESDVIALFEFKTGEGLVAYDTSGVEPALDLNLSGDVAWVGSWGVRINDGKAQGSTSSSEKLHRLIKATNEYSIEAWVVPDNVTQDGPARIVTYSGGPEERNFTLGQTLYNYNFLSRSSNSDANGMPMLSTPDADEVLQATLQHVVVNFDLIEGRSIFVNGEQIVADDQEGGSLDDWDDTFALALGNEVDNQDLWQGTVRFLAIHNRALSAEQIATNFEAGVGEKFFLLFGVSHLIDLPQAYIVFEVQQFDDYSYLFNSPFFISLESGAVPSGDILIDGIRIGVNGQEVAIGQSFSNVNMTINSSNYNATEGVSLSSLGAIISLDKGADEDQFFLSFDQIGSSSYERPATITPEPSEPADLDEQSDIGLRNFGEINATISAVTGVSSSTPSIAAVYDVVKQQLPVSEAIDGFLAAHQAGVMQLSVAYCTNLVNDTTARAAYFEGFNFNASYAAAFNATGRAQIIDPLLAALVANEIDLGDGSSASLTTQPDPSNVTAELNNLIDNMSAADTPTTVIAVCASAVGNAVMLLQ